MEREELIRLAERCEATTGADRALDYEIESLITNSIVIPGTSAYTSSLDAAVSLIGANLPGWFWRCGRTVLFAGWAHVARADGSNTTPGVDEFSSTKAATPALALCAALLRALASPAVGEGS